MMNWTGTIAIAATAVVVSLPTLILPGMTQPARAQACIPLRAVGENATTVEKEVSPPGTGVTRDNWNTDFVVPTNQSFRRYVATIMPIGGGDYSVQMNLKYGNDTADTVYNQVTGLSERQPFSVTGSPRLNANPYQINLQIGGIPVVGKSYRVSVSGCG